MQVDFTDYTDEGTPAFSEDVNGYYIARAFGDAGRWLGNLPEEFAVGDNISIKVNTAGLGSVVVTYWQDRIQAGAFVGSENLGSGEIDKIVTVDQGNLVRVELRGFSEVAETETTLDQFTDIEIDRYIPTDPPIEPPVLNAPTMQEIENADGDGAYSIMWTAVDGATGYQLEESVDDGAWSEIRFSTETTAAIFGRGPGSYCYRVRAFVIDGDIQSDWSNIECTAVIESGGLVAPVLQPIENPENDGAYSIMWNAVAGATGYELEENMNDRGWSPVEEYDGTAVGFDRAWVPVGSYCYRVRAVAGADQSAWSNVQCTSHWMTDQQYVYHLVEPDLTHEWVVTIGNGGSFSASRNEKPPAEAFQEFIDELAENAPSDDPPLLPPSNL